MIDGNDPSAGVQIGYDGGDKCDVSFFASDGSAALIVTVSLFLCTKDGELSIPRSVKVNVKVGTVLALNCIV